MAVTRYVDPDAAAGGDGTTNALSGANCAYVSLQTWESAVQGTFADIQECICESNGAGHTADVTCMIDGSVTTASFYHDIKTSAAGRHAGPPYSTSKYRIEVSSGNAILVQDPNVRITGLQTKSTLSSGSAAGIWLNAADCLIDRCILVGALSGTAGNDGGIVVESGSQTVRNCVAYDWVNGTNTCVGFWNFGTGTITFQNLTAHNCRNGYQRDAGTVNATNCGSAAHTNVGFSGTITQTTCSTTTPTFVNEAGDDFHITAGDSTWRAAGTDLSAQFTVDIDGDTISGTWAIGADWIAAAGGGGVSVAPSSLCLMGVQ